MPSFSFPNGHADALLRKPRKARKVRTLVVQFNPDGSYRTRSDRDALAACVSAMRFALRCPEIYGRNGPGAVLEAIRDTLTPLVNDLDGYACEVTS
jgi:hypothetical protein